MERIRQMLNESADLKRRMADEQADKILEAARMVSASLAGGGKLLLMGNGGSAADAQHIAAELIGRFKRERKAIPALALTVDTSALTALANDYGFETVFSRQVEALAQPGDVVIGISTSGNSENVARGLKVAAERGAQTIALLGNDGGKIKNLAGLAIVVPSNDTARIQETHIAVGHIICELIEQELTNET